MHSKLYPDSDKVDTSFLDNSDRFSKQGYQLKP